VDDEARVGTLRRLGILDTPPDERFDRVTRLAQRVFQVPYALVSLVDEDRQWFKSKAGGLDDDETPREHSFCSHAINQPGIMHVADATKDERLSGNPYVVGEPHVRFYAGRPILAPDGQPVGTLCILNDEPREFTPDEAAVLNDLAAIVEQEIASLQLAVDDGLTGLSNRRGFDLVASQALAFCVRRHTSALLVFADVNGLKRVNDQFGHVAGDRLLQMAAEAMRSSFRAADVVARLGGDEFAALLVDYLDHPSVAIEHLERRVDAVNDGVPDDLRLSLAIGTSPFDPEHPVEVDVLTSQADEAMYAAKSGSGSSRSSH
jgi:diguanylate cyclase (GGDEF)-like protein